MPGRAPRALVVGVGHPDRGDDAVGGLVARELAALGRRDRRRHRAARFDVEWLADPLDLVERWRGYRRVIVVDAVRSGREPGTVERVVLAPGDLAPGVARTGSTHGWGIADTVALAAALGRLPDRLVLVGIEGADFAPGHPLSAAVAHAVPRAVAAVLSELLVVPPGPRVPG